MKMMHAVVGLGIGSAGALCIYGVVQLKQYQYYGACAGDCNNQGTWFLSARDRIVRFSGDFSVPDADGNRCRTSTWLVCCIGLLCPRFSGRYGGICNENHEYQLSV